MSKQMPTYYDHEEEEKNIKKDIEKAINKLGLKSEERITKAYLALEEDYKRGLL